MSNYWGLAALVVLVLLYFKKDSDDVKRPPTVIQLQEQQRAPLANTEAVASNAVEGYSTLRRLGNKMPRGRPIKNTVSPQVERFSRTPSRRNSYSRSETFSKLRRASR